MCTHHPIMLPTKAFPIVIHMLGNFQGIDTNTGLTGSHSILDQADKDKS